jgi:hypothetical protein
VFDEELGLLFRRSKAMGIDLAGLQAKGVELAKEPCIRAAVPVNEPGRTAMNERVIYVFECDDGEHFALTHDLDNLRREVQAFGNSDWHLRSRLRASDKRAAYFEAGQMLQDRLVCFLRLEAGGQLECACDRSRDSPTARQDTLH